MPAYDILALIPNSPGAGQAVVRVPGVGDTYSLPRTTVMYGSGSQYIAANNASLGAATSLGGIRLAGSAGEMAATSQIDPNSGAPADVFRWYWDGPAIGSAAGSAAVLRGMGTNRFSIESGSAMVHIAHDGRFEWEGLVTPRLMFSCYEAGSAIGKSLEIGNSGQTVGQEAVPLVLKTYVAGVNILEWRDHTDALVADVTRSGQIRSRAALVVQDGGGQGGSLYRHSTTGLGIWDAPGNNPGVLFFGNQVGLQADAANTLAQRNGTNAQAFRVYNTFTDASNFERGFLRWSGDVFQIGTEASGTGTLRGMTLIANTRVWTGNARIECGGSLGNPDALYGPSGAIVQAGGAYAFAVGGAYSVTDASFRRLSAGVIELTNGTSGVFRDLKLRSAIQVPPASITPASNGELVFEATSNTSITVKFRGSDGTVRSVALTLA